MTDAGASQTCSPDAHLVQAPGHWQAIDFVSDLHLCEALPRTFDAFAQHLLHSTASAVCILGDLFEVWVGDDMGGRGFELRCVELMAQVSKRKQLAFMVGNRDFLIGNAFLQQTGCWSLPDPTVIEAWGQRCLLTHGDAWCFTDLPYQAFRRQVRSSAWQSEFLARPLDERLEIAAGIRSASKSRRQFDGAADADVDVATAVACLQDVGATTLIHGHTHRPSDDLLAPGLQRHVLTDWDLDQDARAQVLRWTAAGFARLDPTSSH